MGGGDWSANVRLLIRLTKTQLNGGCISRAFSFVSFSFPLSGQVLAGACLDATQHEAVPACLALTIRTRQA
jgi:hypothetical protein